MAEFHVHDGSAWRKAKEIHIHDGSAWRKAKEVWVHDGTAWRKSFIDAIVTGTLSCNTWTQGTDSGTGYDPGRVVGSYSSISGVNVTLAFSFYGDGGPYWDEINFASELPGAPNDIIVQVGSGTPTTFHRTDVGVYFIPLGGGNFFPGSGDYLLQVRLS